MLCKESISNRIFELLDEYDITPNNLANLSNIPPSTLRGVLNNQVENPSSYVIYKICKTLNLELKDFYNSSLFSEENLDD